MATSARSEGLAASVSSRAPKAAPRALVVDDDDGFSGAVSKLIANLGYEVARAGTVHEATRLIKEETFEHILLDLMLPDGSGLDLLGTIDGLSCPTPEVTMVTGDPSIKMMIRRIYGPRIRYLLKPVELKDLETVLGRPTSSRHASRADFEGLIGRSPQMKELYASIERVAGSSANVMIMGESGVGKELVAHAIHNLSGARGDFVAANSAAFNRELVGSELFGHEKGAFTGAHGRRKGLFEQAEHGTLFLDEITEMHQGLQGNLLRVLETKSCVRVGGTSSIPVDCRVISATNRTEREVAQRKMLRGDLLFRLAVYPVKVPPLRDRKDDIADLTHYFVRCFNEEYGVQMSCPESAIRRLEQYDWPGNVRELRHTIHRAVILTGESEELRLPEQVGSPFSQENVDDDEFVLRPGQSIENVEKRLIELTLARYGDDKKQAAALLGVSLKTLYNRINMYARESGSQSMGPSSVPEDDEFARG